MLQAVTISVLAPLCIVLPVFCLGTKRCNKRMQLVTTWISAIISVGALTTATLAVKPSETMALLVSASAADRNRGRSLKTRHRRRCAEYMNSFFSQGPDNCIVLKTEGTTVTQCFDFPTDVGFGPFSRFFNLTSTPDGIVEGNWGTIVNNDPSQPGFASEEVIGVVNANDCTFVLVEKEEQGFFYGKVSRYGIRYNQAQPGEFYAASQGTLMRQYAMPQL